MAEQLDDVENRSRLDNIWILNLKEGAEGDHPIQCFESWLPMTLGLTTAKGCIKLDRAHRTPGLRSDRPHLVIIKLHNSQDKLRILSAARKAKKPGAWGVPHFHPPGPVQRGQTETPLLQWGCTKINRQGYQIHDAVSREACCAAQRNGAHLWERRRSSAFSECWTDYN